MMRTLIAAAVFLGTAAVGLALAALLVPSFHIHVAGFLVAIVVFAIVQAAIGWLVRRFTRRSAPAVAGVAGLISTFIALWIASLFTDGLTFDDTAAWVLATVVVWIVTALLGWLLPKVIPGMAPQSNRRRASAAG
ncbi:phage holin family protein [Rathayibacter sp. YIM 133350]|uniref:phage holin family protein n=1 Tax=Rathayibacter sp. YIM 133350 TaxID=3131992 RepID=UPI00307ED632